MGDTSSDPSNPKVTVVGDGNTGKTSMMVRFVENRFPEEHEHTQFDNYNAKITVDGLERTLALWDTAGQENYSKLRPLSYPGTKVFLLCFAINSRPSFENIKNVWVRELNKHCPGAEIILVATKIDLRPPNLDKSRDASVLSQFVKTKEGRRLKEKMMASAFFECSARTQEGVQAIFQEAAKCIYDRRKSNAGMGNQSGGKSKCCLL